MALAQLAKAYVPPPKGKGKRKQPQRPPLPKAVRRAMDQAGRGRSGIDRDGDGRTGDGTPWERPALSTVGRQLVGMRIRNMDDVQWGFDLANDARPGGLKVGDVVELWVPYERGTVVQGGKAGKHRPVLVVGRHKRNPKYLAVMPFTSRNKRAHWGALTGGGRLKGEEKQSFPLYDQTVIVDGRLVRKKIDHWQPERTKKYISRIKQIMRVKERHGR